MINRRQFLLGTIAASAAAAIPFGQSPSRLEEVMESIWRANVAEPRIMMAGPTFMEIFNKTMEKQRPRIAHNVFQSNALLAKYG